jgi:hypothetical protein
LCEAFPPFRPAAFFCAVVPPWRESPPDPDFFPGTIRTLLAVAGAYCAGIPAATGPETTARRASSSAPSDPARAPSAGATM